MINASNLHTLLLTWLLGLCIAPAAHANKDVTLKDITKYSHQDGKPVLAENYETPFKVIKVVKGESQDKVLQHVYSSIKDARFAGDSPQLLKVGDGFRLFADPKKPVAGPRHVIIVRAGNSVSPRTSNALSNPHTAGEQGQSPATATSPSVSLPANTLPRSGAGPEQEPLGDSSDLMPVTFLSLAATAVLLWLVLRKSK